MVGIGILSPLLLAFAMSNNKMISEEEGDVISKLRSLGLDKKDLPQHAELRRASILVPLFERSKSSSQKVTSDSNNIHVLFTQRPKRMKSHGGEVCFPGGKQDKEDEGCDIQTAVREANEEIGLHHEHIESISRMETIESKHGLCVTPIIGLIQPSSKAEPSQLQLNEDEVEAAFAVPLIHFTNDDNCSIDMIKWKGYEFPMRTYIYDDEESASQYKIWGLTAHVVHQVAMHAYRKTDTNKS